MIEIIFVIAIGIFSFIVYGYWMMLFGGWKPKTPPPAFTISPDDDFLKEFLYSKKNAQGD